MLGAIRRRQHGRHGERGGNSGHLDVAGQAALERVDVLAHRSCVADEAARRLKHPLALGVNPKPRTALYEQYAEHVLQIFDSRRQGRLADTAGFRCAAK